MLRLTHGNFSTIMMASIIRILILVPSPRVNRQLSSSWRSSIKKCKSEEKKNKLNKILPLKNSSQSNFSGSQPLIFPHLPNMHILVSLPLWLLDQFGTWCLRLMMDLRNPRKIRNLQPKLRRLCLSLSLPRLLRDNDLIGNISLKSWVNKQSSIKYE